MGWFREHVLEPMGRLGTSPSPSSPPPSATPASAASPQARIEWWRRWWARQPAPRSRDELDRVQDMLDRLRAVEAQEQMYKALARRGVWYGEGDDGSDEYLASRGRPQSRDPNEFWHLEW